jgi:hypothetical protein
MKINFGFGQIKWQFNEPSLALEVKQKKQKNGIHNRRLHHSRDHCYDQVYYQKGF